MGSFSRTAEQKATPHLEKGKKKQTNVTRKKYCTMVGFQLKAAALLAVLATTQCLANDVSSSQSPAQASHSAYFTEMMVQSPSLEPAKCSYPQGREVSYPPEPRSEYRREEWRRE